MDDISVEDFLAHHGVLGMHWGVRRSVREAQRRRARYKVVNNRHRLSDSDLSSYIGRLQAEKQLKDLVESDLDPGKAAAKETLGLVGKTAVTAVIGTALTFGVGKLLQAKFG